MTDYKVVTSKLRDEAKRWREKAEDAEPILQAVKEAYLSPPAFFVGDLATLVPGAANAALEATYYEEFRAFMEQMIKGAIGEFNQIDRALCGIADEYERTDGINEIDIDKAYHS
ncbi:hypothetical protein [Saccharopolyspora sp. NPDC002376]